MIHSNLSTVCSLKNFKSTVIPWQISITWNALLKAVQIPCHVPLPTEKLHALNPTRGPSFPALLRCCGFLERLGKRVYIANVFTKDSVVQSADDITWTSI